MWKNDKYDGEGTFWYANGDKYHGFWKDGMKNGEGDLELSTGEIYKFTYENGIRIDNFYGQFMKHIFSGGSSHFRGDCISAAEMVSCDVIGNYRW